MERPWKPSTKISTGRVRRQKGEKSLKEDLPWAGRLRRNKEARTGQLSEGFQKLKLKAPLYTLYTVYDYVIL